MSQSTFRGHKIEIHNGEYIFSDTRQLVSATWESRPCGHCGRHYTEEGHDGCLGTLPGVNNACCGHGQDLDAYVAYENGKRLSGIEALVVMDTLKQN